MQSATTVRIMRFIKAMIATIPGQNRKDRRHHVSSHCCAATVKWSMQHVGGAANPAFYFHRRHRCGHTHLLPLNKNTVHLTHCT